MCERSCTDLLCFRAAESICGRPFGDLPALFELYPKRRSESTPRQNQPIEQLKAEGMDDVVEHIDELGGVMSACKALKLLLTIPKSRNGSMKITRPGATCARPTWSRSDVGPTKSQRTAPSAVTACVQLSLHFRTLNSSRGRRKSKPRSDRWKIQDMDS